MSSASISKAIARLEGSAGVRLLHRSTHAFSLTAEGEALLEPAHAVLAAATSFRDTAGEAAAGGGSGIVRVSVSVGLSRAVLAPLLAQFQRSHPEINVDVRASNDIVSLAEDGIDLAIRSGPLDRVPGHIQQRWFAVPWILCATPAYLKERGVPETIEDLQSHDLIGFRNPRTGQIHGWPYRADDGGSARYTPSVRLVFDDGESGWRALLAGAGVGCTPSYMAMDALAAGQASEVLKPWRDEPVDISIIRRERKHTPPRVSALVDYLLQHARRHENF